MRNFVLVGLVVALAGCANLDQVNDSLKKVNDSLSGASTAEIGKMGDGTGYQPALTMSMPGDVCNRKAFADGFKDAFMQNWNMSISTKVSQYQAMSMTKPKDAKVKANLAMYKSKIIGTKGYIGTNMDYQADYLLSSMHPKNCAFRSYQQGKNNGMQSVSEHLKMVVAQEL